MIPFDKYLAFRCPKCNFWQGRQNYKWTEDMSEVGKAQAIRQLILRCNRCNQTTKFKDNKKGGVRVLHKWGDNPDYLRSIIAEANKKK